jgi:hypothetical protein
VVEHSLGKGEVDSSILSGSTSSYQEPKEFSILLGVFIAQINVRRTKFMERLFIQP